MLNKQKLDDWITREPDDYWDYDDETDYPTQEQLETVQKWKVNYDNIKDFIEYLINIWHYPDWGIRLSGKRVLKLELHTGGWSGNEDIIAALRKNHLFWALYWERSDRGGHYYFKIRKPKKRIYGVKSNGK